MAAQPKATPRAILVTRSRPTGRAGWAAGRMRARASTIALVVVAALGTGCMSITTNTTLLSDSSQLGAPYSGTRADLHMLVCFARDVSRNASGLLLAPLMLLPLIDLPLSFVLDTLLLPFDLALEPERAAQVIGAGGCRLFGM